MIIRKKRNQIPTYTIIALALMAVAWDLAVSTLELEPGTFRYESEFDSPAAVATRVVIVTSDYSGLSNPVPRTINPSYELIEEMVGKAIELQGGFQGILEKGDKVMIKVNLVGGNSPSGEGENTDVRVVKALIKHIADFTQGEVEITVAEGTARSNDDPADPSSVWGNSGYTDLLTDPQLSGINLSLLNLNQSITDLTEVDLGSEGTSARQGTKYHVHKKELEADVYIAVPVLKIHDTGITNALKLQIGTAPGCYYGYNKAAGSTYCPDGILHAVEHRVWTTEAIVDLSNIADIDFVVVDAIMCLETEKTNRVYNQVRFNTVLAGADPVAIDHVGTKLMGLNPDDIAHITLAEKVGLGTNNPDKIQVLGVPIEEAMIRVKKSQQPDGRFGQSNRTWILSPAFSGTDISQEFYPNEYSIQPVPGLNGWSQPVYFFDDRIDLHSYYSGQTNVITYAFTFFDALSDQEAELWLGSHEAIYVYLNGELVYSFNSTNTYWDMDRGEYKKTIGIKQGKNTLLVKTLNKFGDFSFALNICEVESDPLYFGNRVAGLDFYIDDSGVNTLPEYTSYDAFMLRSYPNPARDYTKIRFELAEAARTTVGIYDLGGRLVKSLHDERLPSGTHEFTWNLDNDQGNRVGRGVYLCSIASGSWKNSMKLIVE